MSSTVCIGEHLLDFYPHSLSFFSRICHEDSPVRAGIECLKSRTCLCW